MRVCSFDIDTLNMLADFAESLFQIDESVYHFFIEKFLISLDGVSFLPVECEKKQDSYFDFFSINVKENDTVH